MEAFGKMLVNIARYIKSVYVTKQTLQPPLHPFLVVHRAAEQNNFKLLISASLDKLCRAGIHVSNALVLSGVGIRLHAHHQCIYKPIHLVQGLLLSLVPLCMYLQFNCVASADYAVDVVMHLIFLSCYK